MGALELDPLSPLASILLFDSHTLCCHMRKERRLTTLARRLKNVMALKHCASSFSCDFSHIAALLRCTPHPPQTPPLPAKYIGRQVIQGEWGLSPCRESQWVLRCCPSTDSKAAATSPTQIATLVCFCPYSWKYFSWYT